MDTAGTDTLSALDSDRQDDALEECNAVFYLYDKYIPKMSGWKDKLEREEGEEPVSLFLLRNPKKTYGEGLSWETTLGDLKKDLTGKDSKEFHKYVGFPDFKTILFGIDAVESAFAPSLLESRGEGEGGGDPEPFNDLLRLLKGLEENSLKILRGFMEKDKSLEEFGKLRKRKGFLFNLYFFFFPMIKARYFLICAYFLHSSRPPTPPTLRR